MRFLKQELYFPVIVAIHFVFWAIDLSLYSGGFIEVSSDTLFFGTLVNQPWHNIHRILGEIFSSWVVTVFAFNFLMATRARWVERIFGGLDKMYLIHRRSGMIAVALLVAHFVTVPRDLIEFTPGKPLGFYAFVLIIVGVVISAAPPLKKRIPYHKWINVHKLMGVFYVMAVAHAFLVTSLIQELPITRVYVFGMSFIGIAAWVYRAFLFDIFNKKLLYTVTDVAKKGADIVEVTLEAESTNLQYVSGQFAFFNFPELDKREQHPFTLSSHPSEKQLRITVKGLGDYTSQMLASLKVGASAYVEGPYGHFSSSYIKEKKQVWVAGGIGITPFLSLAKDIYIRNVHLFWTVKARDEAVYTEELEALAENNPQFKFTLWVSDERGRITLSDITDSPLGQGYLICGPQSLKKSLFSTLKKTGVPSKAIYDEEFSFR